MLCSLGLFATNQSIFILPVAGTWNEDVGAKDNTVPQEIVKDVTWELNAITP